MYISSITAELLSRGSHIVAESYFPRCIHPGVSTVDAIEIGSASRPGISLPKRYSGTRLPPPAPRQLSISTSRLLLSSTLLALDHGHHHALHVLSLFSQGRAAPCRPLAGSHAGGALAPSASSPAPAQLDLDDGSRSSASSPARGHSPSRFRSICSRLPRRLASQL